MSEIKNPNSFTQGGNGYVHSIDEIKATQRHERYLSKEDHLYELDKQKNEMEYKALSQKQQLGWIGCLFGSSENASKNITATICLVLILGIVIVSVLVYCLDKNVDFITRIWDSTIPIITLALGYLFGKK